MIKKRIILPKLEKRKLSKTIFKLLLKAVQNNQKEIKKLDKYKIIPVSLCDIDKIEVICGL